MARINAAHIPCLAVAVLLLHSAGVAMAHECTCKFQGGDVKQGDTVCIKTPEGKRLARCSMSLNNSSWKMLDEPCPDEKLSLHMSRRDRVL